MGDEYASELTPGEMIEAVRVLTNQAPCLEIREVWNDAKSLGGAVVDSVKEETFTKHNNLHQIAVSVPKEDNRVLLTKFNEISQGKYLDPRSQKLLTVDPVGQSCTGAEDGSSHVNKSSESLRSATERAMDDYFSRHFLDGAASVFATDSGLAVCISATKNSVKNYWSGSWRSTFLYAGGKLTGEVKVNVHYYEDGNIQLTTGVKHSASISASGDEATAKAIMESIEKCEIDFHNGIDDAYRPDQSLDQSFKLLRRKRPFTAQRFEWDQVGVHSLASELTNK